MKDAETVPAATNEYAKESDRTKTIQIEPTVYLQIQEIALEAERNVSKQANRILRKALVEGIDGN